MKVLGICRKINKTLHQNQKIVVLVRLFELVNADRKFTPQRMAIINTVADVFKVPKEETSSIEKFITSRKPSEIEDPAVLILTGQGENKGTTVTSPICTSGGYIVFLHVPSVGLYFFQYTGEQELFLNGLSINNQRIYLFANGSTIKLPRGKPLYYSDVVSHFLHEHADTKISLKVGIAYLQVPGWECWPAKHYIHGDAWKPGRYHGGQRCRKNNTAEYPLR